MKKRKWIIGAALIVLFAATAVFSAYHHEGEQDADRFLAVYPDTAGTKLDHCALCHSGGEYEKKPGKWVSLGSCQWCHHTYGYDASGDIRETLNEYGMDYLSNGRSQAAITAIEDMDSDGDGYTNIEEIDADRYPGNADDDPTKVPAPSRVYTLAELEAISAHTQFILMNASRSDDDYTEYTGVPMEDLLKSAGILGSATGITVYAPDGWSQYHPLELDDDPELYHVNGTYPSSYYYYDTEADMALNATDGWCDYSAPSCQGRSHLDPIVNPDGNKMILAYKREGQYMDPGILNQDNKLDGEGPFRVVPPQKAPSPPDQRSTAGDQDVVWPYANDWDHNSGAATRTATIIKVEPLPPGTTDIDILEAGWDFVDDKKIIVYGAIGQQGGNMLAADLGVFGLWATGSSVSASAVPSEDGRLLLEEALSWELISSSRPEDMASWKDGLAADMGDDGVYNYNGTAFAQISTENPENILGWQGGLAMDLGAGGLWNLNAGVSTQITPYDPEGMMASWGNSLYLDFGASGIWVYDGSELTVLLFGYDPEFMVSWAGGLAVDFGESGLWNWNGSSWNLIINYDTDGLTSWKNGLAVNFGSVYGFWNYDGANWDFISFEPTWATGWREGIAVNFDAFGVWNWDGSDWSQVTPAGADTLESFSTD